jgi:tyrosyl-tRNA synthetase
MIPMLSIDEQLSILSRGTAQVETTAELKAKLERSIKTNRPLRIKYGIDPTGREVHLGHTVPLRKMRQFQDLGHKAVLIIGTATALVGDPSGRDDSRVGLSPDKIEENAKTYLAQIAKIIDLSTVEVRSNSEWFLKWGFSDVLKLLGKTTVQRMLEREDFARRFRDLHLPIYLHECLYPLMQGHDSVEIAADVELGGTEQLFNLMVGRDLQRDAAQEPQICMTMPILRGTDGQKKMGKTAGNYIGVNEPPMEQFGKTMRIPDDLMQEWFELLTDLPREEMQTVLAGKPNEAKKRLGAEIVRFYHGEAAAQNTLEEWRKQFEQGGDPDTIPLIRIARSEAIEQSVGILKLLVLAGLAKSNSEARKKVEEGAVNYGPERAKITDWKATLSLRERQVIRLGRKIVAVELED